MATDPEEMPSWWKVVRRVVVFFLGVAVIIDALWDSEQALGKVIAGLFMVGVLPLDDLFDAMSRSRGRRERVRNRDGNGTGAP